MKRIYVILRRLVRDRFNLDSDKADENQIVASIRRDVEFRGANLWALIFAILIASIGLNVNSGAVVIGAMLISPIMGPIMGVGLGVGINDLLLVKSGVKNLLIAAFFSIITSTLYFWITPLHEAQSEILARTSPSIWDVFIAFFGGLAGIVAGTRKEKSNVIPGVAIATALMPPLCTAGFGLATGHYIYFLGALYLFFINSVFICLSTFLIVRYLRFHRKEFADRTMEKRVSRTIFLIVFFTILPSIYLTYRIVNESIFEANAREFISSEFKFKKTQVVNQRFICDRKHKAIDLLLIGEELSPSTLDTIQQHMDQYNLKNVTLSVRQGLNARQEVDFSAIKASILQDVFSQTDSIESVREGRSKTNQHRLTAELAALYPDLIDYSISDAIIKRPDTSAEDTLKMAVMHFAKRKTLTERQRLSNWLKSRLSADSVKLILE